MLWDADISSVHQGNLIGIAKDIAQNTLTYIVFIAYVDITYI